jgi:hypothetical protein
MPLVQKCYGFITSKSNKRKTNTLVTASNGDLPQPTTMDNSNNGTMANLHNK